MISSIFSEPASFDSTYLAHYRVSYTGQYHLASLLPVKYSNLHVVEPYCQNKTISHNPDSSQDTYCKNQVKLNKFSLFLHIMLLLYPPVAKPSEPPAGIAQLAGTLHDHGHACHIADLNIEGLLYLLMEAEGGQDTWSKRASKNRDRNLMAMQLPDIYSNPSGYQKIVLELNRLLEISGNRKTTVSLSNYQDNNLSPIESSDLLFIAKHPERSPFFPFLQKRIEELLEKHSPGFIGISLNYLSQALNSFALIGCIKKMAPTVPIVVGGGLMTSWMHNSEWKNPFKGLIDHCIDGCGEKPLLDLLGSKEVRTSLPRYDLLSDINYLSPGFILPYSASTGCFWNKCNFCPERAEGNPFYTKTPERVVNEIHTLKEQLQPVLLHFLDNAIPPAVLLQLTRTPPAIPWYGFARVTKHLLDPDFCIDLRRSGCVMLKLGIESGDQSVLDQMEKGLDIHTISIVLQNLKSAGIATYVYLLFGTPAEAHDEARKTLEFARSHHEAITFLNLAIFNMPICSSEKETLETTTFYGGDLSLYTDFHHPKDWGRKKVRKFLDQEFKRQPELAAIIRRDPPIFTSNHAPFFCKV